MSRMSSIIHNFFCYFARWSGTDALQRTGVFYVLTSRNDLAVSKLLVKPRRARGGTTNSLALQETVVSVRAAPIKFSIFQLINTFSDGQN